MKFALVYSYLRFSDPRQRAGSSIERQSAYAAKWATENGMTLDTSLNLRDEGLSAYHRKNVTHGALGVFLRAIETARVPRGSVLIVESLDRLSRADVDIALKQLLDIIHAGITVVTVCDGKVYSNEGVRKNPVDLIVSITVMMRAHEESERKSDRSIQAIRGQCQGWIAGTWRGRLKSIKDPTWVTYNEQTRRFELVAQEVERIRVMIDLYREGHPPARAFAIMSARGIPVPLCVGGTARLHHLLDHRSLIGERAVTVNGEAFTLAGYYPPLMSEAEFASLQFARRQRKRRSGKAEVVSILTGLGITTCASCGYAMANQNLFGKTRQENGLPHNGLRRLYCTGWQKADKRCRVGSNSIVPIERAFLDFCCDQLNLSALFAGGEQTSRNLGDALALARKAVEQTEKETAKYLQSAGSDDNETPEIMKRHFRKLEDQLREQAHKVTALEHELENLHRQSQPAVSEVWAELREGVERLDPIARTKARQLVADTFKSIEVSYTDPHLVGLRLVSKRDIVQILWIDRKTGERVSESRPEPASREMEMEQRRRKHAA